MIKSSNFLVVFASCLCCELCIWPFLCDVLSDFQLSTQKRMKNIFWRAGRRPAQNNTVVCLSVYAAIFWSAKPVFFGKSQPASTDSLNSNT